MALLRHLDSNLDLYGVIHCFPSVFMRPEVILVCFVERLYWGRTACNTNMLTIITIFLLSFSFISIYILEPLLIL